MFLQKETPIEPVCYCRAQFQGNFILCKKQDPLRELKETFLGLNLRFLTHNIKKIFQIIDWVQLHHKNIVFITCSDEDTHLYRALPYSWDLLDLRTLDFKQEQPYNIHYLLSMRFHACVWAALSSIPFCGIIHDPKLSYLCSQLKQAQLKLSEFNPSLLQPLLTKDHYSESQENLKTNVCILHEKSHNYRDLFI